MDNNQPLTPCSLTAEDAGQYVGYTAAALRKWREKGKGPCYIKVGRSVRYRIRDLDAWLDAHCVQTRDSRGTR
jgi:hypothetical protein